MSSNLPEVPPTPLPWEIESVSSYAPAPEPGPRRREWAVSALLLGLTFISTTFAGLYLQSGLFLFSAFRLTLIKPSLLFLGLPYSVPLTAILLAHELGHFLACRYYGMRCTPPYFIPAPIPLTGTFGAFIKIKSPFRHKRALFDIGIAGPLAGFLFVLPTLWIGISLSKLIPKGGFAPGQISFGEPLLFRLFGVLILGYSPNTQDMMAHPMAMAAWVGLLATSLNLLPIWQLDGGHITYSVFGRAFQRRLSISGLIVLILMGFLARPPSFSLLFFATLLLIVGARFRFYHPATLCDEDGLGTGRRLLALVALLILILTFTPVPVSIS